MGSMHTGLEDRARDYPRLAAYFAERARGGTGLIITGGIAPNRAGWISPFAGKLSVNREVGRHRLVTDAVHAEGAHICMQILHAGRYGYHPFIVAPSRIKAPINRFTPSELTPHGIQEQLADFANAAGGLKSRFSCSRASSAFSAMGGSSVRVPVIADPPAPPL